MVPNSAKMVPNSAKTVPNSAKMVPNSARTFLGGMRTPNHQVLSAIWFSCIVEKYIEKSSDGVPECKNY